MIHFLVRSSCSLRSTDCAPVKVISKDKSKLLLSNLDFQHLQYGNSCFNLSSSENKSGWSPHSEVTYLGMPSYFCVHCQKKKSNFIPNLYYFPPKLYFRNFIWTGEDTLRVSLQCSKSHFYSSAVQMVASALIKHNQNILF